MAAPNFGILTRSVTETNRALQELTNSQQSVSREIVKLENLGGVQQGAQLNEIQAGIANLLEQTGGFRQDIADLSEDIRQLQAVTAARDTNVNARMDNRSASQADFRLSPLYSINLEEAFLRQLNQPIPQFPTTVRILKRLTRNRCNEVLRALNIEVVQEEEDVTSLRRRVARVIGIVYDILE